MPYTPNNVDIYTAAYSGAIAGMGVSGRNPTNPDNASYQQLTELAGAFAEIVDTIWASASGNNLDIGVIQEACESVWQDRSPIQFLTTSTIDYITELANAVIAIVNESETYFAGQGITPNTPGGGGSTPTGTGFVHITAGTQDPAAKTVDLASADVTGILPSANMAEADSTDPGTIRLARDIGGTATAPEVIGLQGRDVIATAPADTEVLTWSAGAAKWIPAPGTPGPAGAGPAGSIGVTGNGNLVAAGDTVDVNAPCATPDRAYVIFARCSIRATADLLPNIHQNDVWAMSLIILATNNGGVIRVDDIQLGQPNPNFNTDQMAITAQCGFTALPGVGSNVILRARGNGNNSIALAASISADIFEGT